MSGPVGILGCPGSGKTTLAIGLAIACAQRTGAAIGALDTGRVEQFDSWYHAASVEEFLTRVLGQRSGGEWIVPPRHTAYTPKSQEEFDRICAGLYAAAQQGRWIILIVDELFNVIPSSRSVPENYQRILREWRRVLHGSFFTSQLYRDCGRKVKGLISEWYMHRMTAPEDQDDIQRDHGIKQEVIATLPSAKECHQAGRPISDSHIYLKVGF